MQVWLGRQIEADPGNPAWQELLTSHRSSQSSAADRDELGGPRVLRPRQRITLTSVIDLPHGEYLPTGNLLCRMSFVCAQLVCLLLISLWHEVNVGDFATLNAVIGPSAGKLHATVIGFSFGHCCPSEGELQHTLSSIHC